MGSVLAYTKSQTDISFAKKTRALAGIIRPAISTLPGVPGSGLPTVTWGTASSLPKLVSPLSTGELSVLGKPGVWDDAAFKYVTNGSYIGFDFIHTGANIEIGFVEQTANGSRVWIFVDGAPITTTEGLGTTTSAGNDFWVKLAFGSTARRRITVHATGANAVKGFMTDWAAGINAAPTLPKVAFVSDSFMDGNTGSPFFQAIEFTIARWFDVNPFNGAVGGTGYVTGTTFGNSARVAAVVAWKPDLIIVMGSVNDDGASGVQSAATSLYSAYLSGLPTVPVVVFGPQPSSATGTLSTGRAATNAAIRTAALAATNVLAFYDMLGNATTGTVPATFATGSAWSNGQLTSYNGSIYQFVVGAQSNMGPYTPDNSAHWIPLTYSYTGTGQVGSTTGNGSRDIFLYSDGTHPTAAGAAALSDRVSRELRSLLLNS